MPEWVHLHHRIKMNEVLFFINKIFVSFFFSVGVNKYPNLRDHESYSGCKCEDLSYNYIPTGYIYYSRFYYCK